MSYSSSAFISCTSVQLLLRREFHPFLVRFYLPSAIFVLVSWISFTIDPRVVPGRMALLVTLLLMLINVSTGLSDSVPIANSLTAIEVWLFSCIGFVGMAVVEYALLLLHLRLGEEKDLGRHNSDGSWESSGVRAKSEKAKVENVQVDGNSNGKGYFQNQEADNVFLLSTGT